MLVSRVSIGTKASFRFLTVNCAVKHSDIHFSKAWTHLKRHCQFLWQVSFRATTLQGCRGKNYREVEGIEDQYQHQCVKRLEEPHSHR